MKKIIIVLTIANFYFFTHGSVERQASSEATETHQTKKWFLNLLSQVLSHQISGAIETTHYTVWSLEPNNIQTTNIRKIFTLTLPDSTKIEFITNFETQQSNVRSKQNPSTNISIFGNSRDVFKIFTDKQPVTIHDIDTVLTESNLPLNLILTVANIVHCVTPGRITSDASNFSVELTGKHGILNQIYPPRDKKTKRNRE